jgi:hypothetical protein
MWSSDLSTLQSRFLRESVLGFGAYGTIKDVCGNVTPLGPCVCGVGATFGGRT